jgi:outer membrane murein-binding lipoprotein Lpp
VSWIPLAAWIAAAVVAVLVLGYCAWELIGKARRLSRDLTQLQTLNDQVQDLQTRLAESQERLAATGLR